MLDNDLPLLDELSQGVDAVDAKMRGIVSMEEEVKLLITIPGVNVIVTIGLLAAIGDVQRFATPDQLAAYFGLVPSVSQSGDKCCYGRITKQGRSSARLAVEAAQSLSQMSSPLVASYHRIKRKRGHNVAVTALAKKLIVLVWHLLKKQEL